MSQWAENGAMVGGEKKHRPESLLWRTLVEYAQNSGLHGLRYLGEHNRPWPERVWWTLATLSSLLTIFLLILQTWLQWTQSPVLVSFADKPTPIWNIPFPVVTVCPPNKYRKKIFDMSKTWRVGRYNLTTEERILSDDMRLVLRRGRGTYNKVEDYPIYGHDKTLDNIILMAPTLSDTMSCEDLTSYENCRWVVRTVLTKEGVCYSYNMLPDPAVKTNWSLEEGYSGKAGWDVLPHRAEAGFTRGVALTVKTNQSEMDYTERPFPGVMINFNSPADHPQIDNRQYLLPMTGMTYIMVSPRVMDTDESLRSYSPHQRHCYFPSERRLAHFPTYTQDNCDLECLANYTLRACNCVDIYMPKNASTFTCAVGSAKCVYRARVTFLKEFLQNNDDGRKSEHSCDCKPACTSIDYNVEISQGEINIKKVNEYLYEKKVTTIPNDTTLQLVFIFMRDAEFLSLRRRELYGVLSFIANCGGLLGLCCGFSILTLAEFLYFFTLRIWHNAGNKVDEDDDGQDSVMRWSRRATAMWPTHQAWGTVTGRTWNVSE